MSTQLPPSYGDIATPPANGRSIGPTVVAGFAVLPALIEVVVAIWFAVEDAHVSGEFFDGFGYAVAIYFGVPGLLALTLASIATGLASRAADRGTWSYALAITALVAAVAPWGLVAVVIT